MRSPTKMLIYDIIINTASAAVKTAAKIVKQKHPRKFFRFAQGQRTAISKIKENFTPDSRKVVWLHASSLGEFAIARPLIAEFKHKHAYRVVMTFFSPTGYEALQGKQEDIDSLFYLPLDTKRNVRTFLDTVRPDKAVFMVSEYWYNYLGELRRRNIDTYLVSAKILRTSAFFKSYGHFFRKCLEAYRHIFVIDKDSERNLADLGYAGRTSITGNPLFDNAALKAATPWHDDKIARFTAGHRVMIAGSIHDSNDLQMVARLANRHPAHRFIFVPHETSPATVAKIKDALKGKAVAYSECATAADADSAQVLIIDFVGALSYIYRYGAMAYIGGGFTPYLHSLVEATVYGLPVSFGPCIRRKVTPSQLIERGLGTMVRDADELDAWYERLRQADFDADQTKRKALAYVDENTGNTGVIVNEIMNSHS